MAFRFRSGKTGDDWNASDLLAYKITVSSQSPENFYDQPLPTVTSLGLDPNLVTGTLDVHGLSDETYRLLQYLDLASRANSRHESASHDFAHDFAREILRALGYEMRGLLLRSHHAIPLLIQHDSKQSAQTDVCLVQGSTILLVVHEDKTIFGTRDPDPQVIIEAIAAFQSNNRVRARLGEPELDSMTIPCIAMLGTQPIFYLVPVTQMLSQAVATGKTPYSRTEVQKCVVVSNSRRSSEGMDDPYFRQVAFQHYVAFRTLAMKHFSAFMMSEMPTHQMIMGA